MPCIFCEGDGKLTKEHVIPKWLGSVLHRAQAPTGSSASGKRFTHRFTPAPGEASSPREWSADEVDLVTNSVCQQCNSGWLHDLETMARPVLTRLVLGESTICLQGSKRRSQPGPTRRPCSFNCCARRMRDQFPSTAFTSSTLIGGRAPKRESGSAPHKATTRRGRPRPRSRW